MNDRIQIKRVKVGTWHPKTYFDTYVDDEYVGRYKTKKEAVEKGEAQVKYIEEQWKSLGEEFDDANP